MNGQELRWPAERFYWAVLDAPQWRRCGELPPGLRQLLEDDLPVPADSVHAVGASVGDGRVLVCALDAAAVESAGPHPHRLAPAAIPEFVAAPIDPALLNLLVGRYEPPARRRARVRRYLIRAAAVLVASALLSIGLLRRAEMWYEAAHQARGKTAAAVERALPKGTPDLLSAELCRTRRLAEAAGRLRPPHDAAQALESLLRAWPRSVSSKPQLVALSESGATISVTIDGDPTPFLRALKPPPGWSMEEPRLNAAETVTRLTLQLRPTASAGGLP